MADDNRPLKYARYAIGEIVLVVIGILIALQINEWNEVKKNDKVAILSANMPHWGIAHFAISFLGAVVVPILPDFHETEIQNVLEHSEAKVIFVSEHLISKVKIYERIRI